MKKRSKTLIGITAGVLFAAVIVIVAVIMASGSDSKKYAKHMESAQRYMDELQYEQAIAEYKAAIKIDPNNVEAYHALAELYVQTGDYESAIAVLNQGMEQTGSEELSDYIEEVQAAYEEQKALAEAHVQEEESVAGDTQEQNTSEETDEDRYNGYLEQGQELIDGEHYEHAIEVYESAIALLPEREEAYRALAEVYVLMEDYESAVEILSRGIEQTESEGLAEYLEEVQGVLEEKRAEEAAAQAETEQEQMQEERQQSQQAQGEEQKTQEMAEGNGAREEKHYWADYGTLCYIDEYDANGKLVKSTYYHADGTTLSAIYEHDANGNRVKDTQYNVDGALESYTIYAYDANGYLVKIISYNADGTLSHYWIDEYDANGKPVKMTSYNADGALDNYIIYEYDANGYLVKIISYNADGTIGDINDFGASLE